MDKAQSDRLIWIDILKGITILLVVAGHALDGVKDSICEYNAVSTYLRDGIYIFHMPLFITISGYIFSFSYLSIMDNQKESVTIKDKEHYRKQIYNLLLMYTIFSTLIFSMKFICSNWVNDSVHWIDLILLPVKVIPGSPYWYLYVLVFLYMFSYWILKRSWNKDLLLLFLFALSIIYTMSGTAGEVMILRVFYYIFFFVFGCLYQIRNHSPLGAHYLSCWVLGLIGMIIYLCGKNIMPIFLSSIVKVLASLFIVNAIMETGRKYGKHQNIWSFLGKRSLEIYTLHVFITSGIRVLLKILNMNHYWVNVIIAILLGILIPIFCSYILKKINLWSCLYRPVNWTKK